MITASVLKGLIAKKDLIFVNVSKTEIIKSINELTKKSKVQVKRGQ